MAPTPPWRRPRPTDTADRRLHEAGGPTGGTRGGYIDSFENMPGAQNQPFGSTPPKAFVPSVGLTVEIGAGPESTWLDEPVVGTVCDIVPGQLHEATTVVKLEAPIDAVGRTGRTVTGEYLLLEPSGSPSRWRRAGVAHVEVWAEPPSSDPWLERAAGVWVDDAAPYEFG
ncbi:MAG: hypothetical protein AAF081_06930 [Actinomycetota bacterium]